MLNYFPLFRWMPWIADNSLSDYTVACMHWSSLSEKMLLSFCSFLHIPLLSVKGNEIYCPEVACTLLFFQRWLQPENLLSKIHQPFSSCISVCFFDIHTITSCSRIVPKHSKHSTPDGCIHVSKVKPTLQATRNLERSTPKWNWSAKMADRPGSRPIRCAYWS